MGELAADELPFFGMAWRFFALDTDGTLVAPFVDTYWPGAAQDRRWETFTKRATCIAEDHAAPVESCSCGIAAVKSWPAFLEAVTVGRFADSPVPVIEECPVIARVKLSGRVFPSREANDPPSTFRAEQVTLVAVHLGPSIPLETAQKVADRYRDVRCFTYPPESWPVLSEATERVWPTPTTQGRIRFLKEVRRAGFGAVGPRDLDRIALQLGDNVVQALRGGATPEDLGSVLFDLDVKPTFAQARTLVLAAAEHLSPGLLLEHGGYQHARPIPLVESMLRPLSRIATKPSEDAAS